MSLVFLNRPIQFMMHDKFTSKTNDFVTWCETAIDHYNKGYYADSLLNMRKSGEAASKLMFYYRYSEKVAVEKTEDKSYKELIQALIQNDLAERKVINWLEALQIHGNDAAHDRQVEKEHADFAINALKLFINWLFAQCIKSAVPERLIKAVASMEKTATTGRKDTEIQKELDRIKKEKADLEKLLATISEKKNEEAEKANELSSVLERSITRLSDLEQDKEKNRINESTVPKEIKTEVVSEKKPAGYRKKIVLAISLVSVFFILFFILKQWNNTVSENGNKIIASPTGSTADSFRVLLLPLSVMQDNPNMVLKFEDAMQSSIRQRIKEKNIPVSVFFDREFIKPSVSIDEATQQGTKNNTNVVLFGDMYEPLTSSDSAQVNIKFVLNRQPNTISEEMGPRSFLHLSDSASIKIQAGVVCFVDLAFADFLMSKGKYNQALAILYDSKPVSIDQQINVADFLSTCHSSSKNYVAAAKEIEKLITLQTKNKEYGYGKMADVLNNMGDFKHAEEYYKKAISIKSNDINILLNYAQMLSFQPERRTESVDLVQQAIHYDSTNSRALWYLGDMEKLFFNDFKKAEKYYRKSISIDSSNVIVKTNLAEILSFNLDKPEEGLKIYLTLVQKDTTNSSLLFSLANIYTTTRLKNPDKAEYYLAKSKKYQSIPDDYSTNYAEGLVAINKFDYKKATQLLYAAYKIDSSSTDLCNKLANSYFNIKDYDKALYFVTRAWKKDSLDYVSNVNIGSFYLNADKKYVDMKKSAYYLEKALKTNPYGTEAMQFLITVYSNMGNFPGIKDLLFRLYDIQPDNFLANKGLGEVYWMDGDYKKAVQFYETALSLNPDDDVVNSKYALNLMKVSSDNFSTAMKYAKKAVEINPDNADNLYMLAQMYVIGKDYKHGKEYYYKALALNPAIKDPSLEQDIERHR